MLDLALDEFPKGMVDLIWRIINKLYYVDNDKCIPLILIYLSRKNIQISSFCLDIIIESCCQENIRTEVKKKIDNLKIFYFENSNSDSIERHLYKLTHQWEESLNEGLEKIFDPETPNFEMINVYQNILNTEYNQFLDTLSEVIKNKIKNGFTENAIAFLCVDLANLSQENLEYSTDIYVKFHELSILDDSFIKFVQKSLQELWITYAWIHRNSLYEENNYRNVRYCYDTAFDLLELKDDYKEKHAYATFLRDLVLMTLDENSTDYKKLVNEIEKLYLDVIEGQKKNLELDPLSYSALAIFYSIIGKATNAREIYEKYLSEKERIIYKIIFYENEIVFFSSYAEYLKNLGSHETDLNKKQKYFCDSERLYLTELEKLNEKLDSEEINGKNKKIEKYEYKLKENYIRFLNDKLINLDLDEKEKINLYKKIKIEFDNLYEKNENKGSLIILYAKFLIQNNEFETAIHLLHNFIENNAETYNNYYFKALIQLAKCKLKNSYSDPEFNKNFNDYFEDIEKDFLEASKSINCHQNANALFNLGKLYIKWAELLKNSGEENWINKIESAKDSFKKALDILEPNKETIYIMNFIEIECGILLVYDGKFKKSENYYKPAIIYFKLNKPSLLGSTYYNLALAYQEKGNHNCSAYFFSKAAKSSNYNCYENFISAAKHYILVNKFDEAINCYNSILNISGFYGYKLQDVYVFIAKVYIRKGDLELNNNNLLPNELYIENYKSAAENYRLAMKYNEAIDCYISAGSGYKELKNYDEALNCFKSAETIAQNDISLNIIEILKNQAEIYQLKGSFLVSGSLYEEAAKKETNKENALHFWKSAEIMYKKSDAYKNVNTCKKACKSIEQELNKEF